MPCYFNVLNNDEIYCYVEQKSVIKDTVRCSSLILTKHVKVTDVTAQRDFVLWYSVHVVVFRDFAWKHHVTHEFVVQQEEKYVAICSWTTIEHSFLYKRPKPRQGIERIATGNCTWNISHLALQQQITE